MVGNPPVEAEADSHRPAAEVAADNLPAGVEVDSRHRAVEVDSPPEAAEAAGADIPLAAGGNSPAEVVAVDRS